MLLGVGMAQFLSQIFIVFGYRYASAVRLSPIVYSVIVFSAVIDWVAIRALPTPRSSPACPSSSAEGCWRS